MSPSLPFHKRLEEGNLILNQGLFSTPAPFRASEMKKPSGYKGKSPKTQVDAQKGQEF